jgi:hypothetical protein
LSMTVIPVPRAPVYSVARPDDPGPSSSASTKSSSTPSRPTSNGGLTPKLAWNGFDMQPSVQGLWSF